MNFRWLNFAECCRLRLESVSLESSAAVLRGVVLCCVVCYISYTTPSSDRRKSGKSCLSRVSVYLCHSRELLMDYALVDAVFDSFEDI